MQQPRRSLSASNLPSQSSSASNNNPTTSTTTSSTSTTTNNLHNLQESASKINYHELMQMMGSVGAGHHHYPHSTSVMIDPTTPLSANTTTGSSVSGVQGHHPFSNPTLSTTQLLLEELNSAVDHTHHQATLQMLASGLTGAASTGTTGVTDTSNTTTPGTATAAALLSAAHAYHPYYQPSHQYSPYHHLYHPLGHPIHPLHFQGHHNSSLAAALYDQSTATAAAAVLLQQQQQSLLNHSQHLHSLPTTATATTTTTNNNSQLPTTTTTNTANPIISEISQPTNTMSSQPLPIGTGLQTDEEEDDSDAKTPLLESKKDNADGNTSECEENREWTNVHVNRDFLDASNVQLNIYLETRDSGPRNDSIVEPELYSSIKYEMRHEIKSLKFLNESDNDLQLFCRVQIIHPDNKNEVLKNGKTILGGVVESNVSKGNVSENIASTSMKIKFTDCSYHHGNCRFAFRVSYFIESDLDEPILIKESASFKVLARKPSKNKTKKQASKRKRKEQEEAEINTITTTPQSSPQKVKISSFDDFKQVTTSVFDYIQNNTDEQKKRQMINYVITKLYSVDPNIMFSLPTDDGANDIFKGLL